MTIWLPFWLVDGRICLQRVVAARSDQFGRKPCHLVTVFALSRPEQHFVRRLLTKKRNLWLFRCNQQGFCGDFVVVDMSPKNPDERSAYVVELKSRGRLKIGGGGAGVQFQNAENAVREIAKTTGVIGPDSPVTLVCGDTDDVLKYLGA